MRKTSLAVAAILAASLTTPALAARGDMLIKLRGNYQLRSQSEKVAVSIDKKGGGAADYRVRGSDAAGAEASATYFFTDRFATELAFGGASYDLKESSGRALLTSGTITPTVTLQYHPITEGRFRPYLGAGAAYVLAYSEKPGNLLTSNAPYPVSAYSANVNGSFAPVAQVGVDVSLDDKLYLNVDAKYMLSGSDVTVVQSGNSEQYGQDVKSLVVGVGVGFRF